MKTEREEKHTREQIKREDTVTQPTGRNAEGKMPKAYATRLGSRGVIQHAKERGLIKNADREG